MTAAPGPPPDPAPAPSWHRRAWTLAGPLILTNLTTPLVGAVDSAVVGHLPASFYLGAVGIGSVVFNALFWMFSFLRMGTIGLAAQALGAARPDEALAVFGRALLLALAIGAAMIALSRPIEGAALWYMGPGPEVAPHARDYIRIRILSAPAMLADYALLGWFVGVHNTRAALAVALATNVVNVGLDLLFVVGFGWAVKGVAAATVAAHYAAVGLGLWLAAREARRLGARLDWRRVRAAGELRRLFAINRDIMIRTFFLIASFSAVTAIGARIGDTVLAVNALLLNLQSLMTFAVDGFSHAAQALVGRAVGAGDREGARLAVRACALWGVGIAALYAAGYGLFGDDLIALLTSLPEVRALAREYLIWAAFSPLVSVGAFLMDGVFLGATRTAAMRDSMILSAAIYAAALAVLVPALGNHGLWLSVMILLAARALTLGVRYPALLGAIGH
ncbi:MAG: MATE family efflux transporter [Proteobacteria bacterium]|nr:MATE family efflux transporter [Pseudomonadota bacterium]